MHVHHKVRFHAGRGEYGPQSLFDMSRLVRLIANEHKGVRTIVVRLRRFAVERRSAGTVNS